MKVSVVIGQFPISSRIEENFNNIMKILECTKEDDLVVLPEGALSGYSDDISFLDDVDIVNLNKALTLLKKEAVNKQIHLIFGSCIYENSYWLNAAIGYSYCNEDFIYKKVNLATHERNVFKPGDELPIYEINIKGEILKLGIQLCREARYPEQWRYLAMNGAEVYVYITNAISGVGLSVWRSHLVSRAAENQRFLISCNNANENQHCPTMLISPKGEIISEIVSSEFHIIKETINTDEISNWYLDQCREDVVKLVYLK